MLLFWPCAWGLTLAYYYNSDISLYIKHLTLFFLGSVLMRSGGCIFNDIVDRNFDKKVDRTKNRPIASGKISVIHAFVYVIILCLLSLLILLQFNWLTIILGMSSMILAFSYPFMKRYTYWPQLFLGLTFARYLFFLFFSENSKHLRGLCSGTYSSLFLLFLFSYFLYYIR